MTKTTITIVVEHYTKTELDDAISEVCERITDDGYTLGKYSGENDLSVEFSVVESEA